MMSNKLSVLKSCDCKSKGYMSMSTYVTKRKIKALQTCSAVDSFDNTLGS